MKILFNHKNVKDIAIFKVDNKKNEKAPDYRLMIKIDDNWSECGAGWIKTSSKGTKFISCKLSDAYKDVRKGWHLANDKPIETQSDNQFLTPEEQERVKEAEFKQM